MDMPEGMWISHHAEPIEYLGSPAWELTAYAHIGEQQGVRKISVKCAGGRGSFEQTEMFWYLDDRLKRMVRDMEKALPA
jgi:hypothetical protein